MATRVITSLINGYQPCPSVSWATFTASLTTGVRPLTGSTSRNSYYEITPAPTGKFKMVVPSEGVFGYLSFITINIRYNENKIVLTDGDDSQYLQRSGDIYAGYFYVGYIVDDESHLGSVFLVWQNTDCNRNNIMALLPSTAMYNAIIAEVNGGQWRNVDFGLGSIESTGLTTEFWTRNMYFHSPDSLCNEELGYHAVVDWVDSENFPNGTIYTKGDYSIVAERSGSGIGYECRLKFYFNGNIILDVSCGGNSNHRTNVFVCFGINETTHRGSIAFAIQSVDNYSTSNGYSSSTTGTSAVTNSELAYNWITAAMPVIYNWKAVEQIRGKLGTFNLAQIVEMNNGNPRDAVSRNDIQLSNAALVSNLIGEIVSDKSNVVVKYFVPDTEYEYVKLVYKVDSAPDSVSDGTAINIDPQNSSVTISGIADNKKRYFVIFTNKNQSEPYEFTAMQGEDDSWHNEEVHVSGFNSSTLLITDWFSIQSSDNPNEKYTNGTNLMELTGSGTLIQTEIFKITYEMVTSGGISNLTLNIYDGDTVILTVTEGSYNVDFTSLGFGINSTTSQGQIVLTDHNIMDGKYYVSPLFASTADEKLAFCYEAIMSI